MAVRIAIGDNTAEFQEEQTMDAVVAALAPPLHKTALAIEVEKTSYDLSRTVGEISQELKARGLAATPIHAKVLTFEDEAGKEIFWHSSAHVLAQALKRLYPQIQLEDGPVVKNGPGFFFYDVLLEEKINEQAFEKIEAEIQKIVRENLPVRRVVMERSAAVQKFRAMGEHLKVGIIEKLPPDAEIRVYEQGEFADLCRGPHVPSTGKLGVFKLTSVAGAYLGGDANNPMLQRIYAVSFPDKKLLNEYFRRVEETKKRDHRRLGTDLELFTTSEDIGPGLILWLPRGNIIKEELENWAKETEARHGYQRVTTPVVTKEKLFYTSEHLPHYRDSMFPPMQMDNENYYIKPMNCPFHHTIFAHRPRSYRELPLRLAEYGLCHRYEDSGALFGLMRVRAMQMNDAHIYCTEEQAVEEFKAVIRLHEYYYKALNITEYYMVLSLRNPANKKYHGDEAMWAKAEALTRQAMEESGVEYIVENDGAAFYGPKMDFQIRSSIGREFTASTCQLDLFMPMKFDLKYVDKDGTLKRPVCIHRSPLGTHERFIGFLIEHFAGAFPTWLAPEQVRILPVNEGHMAYAQKLRAIFIEHKIRVNIEPPEETLGKRIRTAEKLKIPYMLVVGDREVAAERINARNYFTGTQQEYAIEEFLRLIEEEIRTKKIIELQKQKT
ncbi:MAG: threonine--tRNA ligase [Leptospiraceae bacterium]|nr:threonine--tRNA ligase [Leptospiraceae bacterium]